jgi:hypothetical protein
VSQFGGSGAALSCDLNARLTYPVAVALLRRHVRKVQEQSHGFWAIMSGAGGKMMSSFDHSALDAMRATLFSMAGKKPLPDASGVDHLFHYTGADVFVKLVKDPTFWATHAQYLNDQTEYVAGMKIVRDTIAEIAASESDTHLRRMLDQAQAGLANSEHRDAYPYIVSFSEAEDLLSQWRAYGTNGSGFAIGYRVSTLARTGRLLRCVYVRAALEQQLQENYRSEIVPLVKECLRERSEVSPPEYLVPGQVLEGLLVYFRSMAACYKDLGYSEEREWRLVVNAEKNQRDYRTNSFRGVVPYCKVMSKRVV